MLVASPDPIAQIISFALRGGRPKSPPPPISRIVGCDARTETDLDMYRLLPLRDEEEEDDDDAADVTTEDDVTAAVALGWVFSRRRSAGEEDEEAAAAPPS